MFVDSIPAAETDARNLLFELLDLFENANVGLMLLASDGTVLRASNTQRRQAGWPDSAGAGVGESVSPSLLRPGQWREICAVLERGEIVHNYPVTIPGPDGSAISYLVDLSGGKEGRDVVRWVTRPAVPTSSPGDNAESAAGVWAAEWRPIDINPLVRAVEAAELESRIEELADLFEYAPVPIHQVGDEGMMSKANETQLNQLDYDHSGFVGHEFTKFFNNTAHLDEMVTANLANEPIVNYTTTAVTRTGDLLPVVVYSTKVGFDGSRLLSRCFLFEPATAQGTDEPGQSA